MAEQDNLTEVPQPFSEAKEVREFLQEILVASGEFDDAINAFVQQIKGDKNLDEILVKYNVAKEKGIVFPPVLVGRFEKTIELKNQRPAQSKTATSQDTAKTEDASEHASSGAQSRPGVASNEQVRLTMTDPVTAGAMALGGALGGILNFAGRSVQKLTAGRPQPGRSAAAAPGLDPATPIPLNQALDNLKGALKMPVKDWDAALLTKSMASLSSDLADGGKFSKDDANKEEIKETLAGLQDRADEAIKADPKEKERLKDMLDICKRLMEMVTQIINNVFGLRGLNNEVQTLNTSRKGPRH